MDRELQQIHAKTMEVRQSAHDRHGPQPVHVAQIVSLTGTMSASERGVFKASLAAIQALNESPLGSRYQLVPLSIDSHSTIRGTREAIAQLAQQPSRYAAIFGPWTSASRKLVQQNILALPDPKPILFYPVQFEGMENRLNTVYLGELPNQQVYPLLRHLVRNKHSSRKNLRVFIIGSDYVYARVVSQLIVAQLEMLQQTKAPSIQFIHFDNSRADHRDVRGDIRTAVSELERGDFDVVLNLINGDAITAFFEELLASPKTRKIPTYSFSATLRDLKSVEQDWEGQHHLVAADFPKQVASEGSVKACCEAMWGKTTITAPMFNVFAGVQLFGRALDAAKNHRADSILQAFRDENVSLEFTDGSDKLVLDRATLQPFKSCRVAPLIQRDGEIQTGDVKEIETDIAPKPFPNFGRPQDLADWADFIWLFNDYFNWLADEDGVGEAMNRVVKLILGSQGGLINFNHRKMWADLIDDPTSVLFQALESAKKLFIDKFHDLEKIQGALAVLSMQTQADADRRRSEHSNLPCPDPDVREAAELPREHDAIAISQFKMLVDRHGGRIYLADLLNYCRTHYEHSVQIRCDGKPRPADLPTLVTLLGHRSLRWDSPEFVVETFRALQWPSLQHFVDIQTDREGRPQTVLYRAVALGKPLDEKLDRAKIFQVFPESKHTLTRLTSAMRVLFGDLIDGGAVELRIEGFDQQQWLANTGNGSSRDPSGSHLWLHSWPVDTKNWMVAIAGQIVWTNPSWPTKGVNGECRTTSPQHAVR